MRTPGDCLASVLVMSLAASWPYRQNQDYDWLGDGLTVWE